MQQPAKTLLRSWRDTIRHKTFPADEFAAAVHPCRDHEPSERQANGARADARIDARGRDGGVREELAVGVVPWKPTTEGESNQLEREDCTLVAWYRSLYAPRAGGAHDSHHRTAATAGRTRRRGG